MRLRWWAWTVGEGLLLLSAACSTPTNVHPVQRGVVGTLHIDAQSGCSWVVEHAGVVQTVWVDGTQVDGTHQPVGVQPDGHPIAEDGQPLQALQGYGVAGKPPAGCPAPAGAETLSAYRLHVRSPVGG